MNIIRERFEIIDEYKDKGINLPKQKNGSEFYNIEAAEDIIVPSLFNNMRLLHGYIPMHNLGANIVKRVSYFSQMEKTNELYTIKEINDIVDELNLITMIPTGIKANLDNGTVLGIYNTLTFPHQIYPQIIDSNYNDHILISMINLSPYDIKIKKGDIIARALVYIRDTYNSITDCKIYDWTKDVKTEYVDPIEYEEATKATSYIQDPNCIITAQNNQGDEQNV